MKKYIWIILAIILLISCRTTNDDIDNFYHNSEFEEIVEYLEKSWNGSIDRHIETNMYAIDKLITSGELIYIKQLENIYFNRIIPIMIHKYILRAFNKYDKTFQNYQDLIADDWYMSFDRLEMLGNYSDPEIYYFCYESLKTDHKGRNFINGVGYNDLINSISKNEFLKTDKDQLIDEFKRSYKIDRQYQILELELDSLASEIKDVKSEMSYIENELSEQIPYENLYAYVVQKSDFNGTDGYEVVKRSGVHCILLTSETEFKSKGWFSMKVVKSPFAIDVNIDGGFTQQWDCYIEVLQSSIDERKIMNSSLVDYRSQLKKLERKLSAVESKLNK